MLQLGEVGTPRANLTAKLLLGSFRSSPAALEHSLQRLAEGLEAQSELDDPLGESEDDLSDGESDVQTNRNSAGNIAEASRQALQQMEEIGDDSKLRAFGELLAQINEVGMPSKRVCVITNYLGTLYYLAAEIEDQGRVCLLLHGGMPADERQAVLAQFSNKGTVLIATTAMLQGIELPEVTDIVLYDIPSSKIALQVILGRFDRFGRQNRLSVHALIPANVGDGYAEGSHEFLHELLEPSHKVQPPPTDMPDSLTAL